jgi:hypothetical protein
MKNSVKTTESVNARAIEKIIAITDGVNVQAYLNMSEASKPSIYEFAGASDYERLKETLIEKALGGEDLGDSFTKRLTKANKAYASYKEAYSKWQMEESARRIALETAEAEFNATVGKITDYVAHCNYTAAIAAVRSVYAQDMNLWASILNIIAEAKAEAENIKKDEAARRAAESEFTEVMSSGMATVGLASTLYSATKFGIKLITKVIK